MSALPLLKRWYIS